MTVPAGMTDLFPAFAFGGVALIGLMVRIAPPAPVRFGVVAVLGLLLVLYLTDQLHLWLPDRIGLPLYIALLLLAGGIMVWNWKAKRGARKP
jgi:prepilin signal peptidase PulO-like enzyme (type II secretory pathway)